MKKSARKTERTFNFKPSKLDFLEHQQVARGLRGVEANKVLVAAPNETFVGNQVAQEEERIVIQAELSHVEFHHAFLGVVHRQT